MSEARTRFVREGEDIDVRRCTCGDILPADEFCEHCGNCQMLCCRCYEPGPAETFNRRLLLLAFGAFAIAALLLLAIWPQTR